MATLFLFLLRKFKNSFDPLLILKNLIMETKNLKIRVSELEVHQEVKKTFKKKEMSIMEFSMNRFGQEQPITVIESIDKYFIIDGLCRFEIAKKHIDFQPGFPAIVFLQDSLNS